MGQNSSRWVRSVVWLWLLLPLMLQGFLVAGYLVIMLAAKGLDAISPQLTRGALLPVLMVIWLVLVVLATVWLCFRSGQRFVRLTYFSTSPLTVSRNFFSRYLGLVIVSGYTVLLALAAIFVPVSERGALLNAFASIFTVGHLPTLAVVWLSMIFAKPLVWPYLVPLTLIYVSYAAGMAWQFRASNVPPTLRAGRAWFAALLIVSGVLFAWRYHAIYENYINISGREFDEGESNARFWSDRDLTRQYDPWEKDNRLVRIAAPTLNGEPLTISDDCPKLDGATGFYPVYAALASAIYPSESLHKHLRVSSTPIAYKNLLSGSADIIFALKPSAAQLAEAKERGVEYRFTPICREAFVFFVNETNSVANLTEEQLRDIYTKRVTNWSQVGGRAEKILAFQRPPDSGSQTTMESLVMRGEPIAKPLMEEVVQGMGGIVCEVAAYRDDAAAIGYSFLFFTREMAGWEKLRLLSVSGVSPSAEKIRSREYPYIAEFYAVTTAASAEKPNVKKLLAWLQSVEGRELVEKVGYIASPAPAEQR